MFLILVISVFMLTFFYTYFHFQYWKRRNVEGPEPTLLFGNILEQFMGKKHMGEIFRDIYFNYQDKPVVGVFNGAFPCLLVRDPILMKEINVASFKHFSENDFYVDKKVDPLLGRSPVVLKGEEWKTTRNILTPCFTSGKMKIIFPLIDHVGKKMVAFVNRNMNEPIELKELCTKYTIDNVASAGFGLEGKCFEEPYSEFRKLAIGYLTPGTISAIKISLGFLMPFFTKMLSMKLVNKDVEDKLIDIVTKTIKYREENNVVRQDFLHFINQLRYQTSGKFTYEDVTAQIAAFFLDGYEISSTVMSFLLFELACNQDKQDKLREEILSQSEDLTFEMLSEFTYLDACLTESLRKNPTVFVLRKVCTENYTYIPSEKSGFHYPPLLIEKGTRIIFPIGGLYTDPKYFEDADKFIPERFLQKSDENSPYVFKSFGEGPRACLGKRYAQLQIKAGIYHLIKNFKFSLNEKTQLPIKFHPWHFSASVVGGLWVNVEPI